MDRQRVAERFEAAIAANDEIELRACYEAGAEIWHNTDGVVQTVEQNLELSRRLRRRLPDLEFKQVRNIPTAEGFVRLSVLCGTTVEGVTVEIPLCAIASVSNSGLIRRLNEYLDPSPLARARQALGGVA
jgi:hypothetical protein